MREYKLLLGLALRNRIAAFRAGSWKREGGKLDRGRIASTVVMVLCMGIMGQYLAKTYLEVKRRPHYIIAETNDESAKLVG